MLGLHFAPLLAVAVRSLAPRVCYLDLRPLVLLLAISLLSPLSLSISYLQST